MQHFNDPVDIERDISVHLEGGLAIGRFSAMASPCDILFDTQDTKLAEALVRKAAHETWRIEQKFSRYREDGIIPRINNSEGRAVIVDDETAMLLDFAFQCYEISDGLFDITSGVLRRAWKFDGSDRLPEAGLIESLLPQIGLEKVDWQKPQIRLQPGMEIDFGGIGKEYAVDRVLQLLTESASLPVLVNFGGDIAASGARANGEAWKVGIEAINCPDTAEGVVAFRQGGIATSGDAQRFLLKDGIRYSHILNPKTGWPVENSPHAITVLADNCTQAGILSTLAMLQGPDAEAFLEAQQVTFWVQR